MEFFSTVDWGAFGLWWVVFGLAVVGLAGTIIPAVPGLPLVFAACLLAAWLGHFEAIGFVKLTILGILTLIGMAVDWFAQVLGAKKTGASPYGIAGALVGTVVGLFFGLFGILFLPLIGAVIGELLAKKSLLAAGGMLVGAVVKVVLGLMMIGILVSSLMTDFPAESETSVPQQETPAEVSF